MILATAVEVTARAAEAPIQARLLLHRTSHRHSINPTRTAPRAVNSTIQASHPTNLPQAATQTTIPSNTATTPPAHRNIPTAHPPSPTTPNTNNRHTRAPHPPPTASLPSKATTRITPPSPPLQPPLPNTALRTRPLRGTVNNPTSPNPPMPAPSSTPNMETTPPTAPTGNKTQHRGNNNTPALRPVEATPANPHTAVPLEEDNKATISTLVRATGHRAGDMVHSPHNKAEEEATAALAALPLPEHHRCRDGGPRNNKMKLGGFTIFDIRLL